MPLEEHCRIRDTRGCRMCLYDNLDIYCVAVDMPSA